MSIEAAIKQFLMENMLFSDTFDYPEEASLLEGGVLDSTGVLEMVLFIEETYSFQVPRDEITPENFDSVANLAGFIRAHALAGTPT